MTEVTLAKTNEKDAAERAGPAASVPEKQSLMILVRMEGISEVSFKLKDNTPFRKVFDAYVTKNALQANTIRFTFDGRNIAPDATPAMLDMQDGDIVDAFVAQIGG